MTTPWRRGRWENADGPDWHARRPPRRPTAPTGIDRVSKPTLAEHPDGPD